MNDIDEQAHKRRNAVRNGTFVLPAGLSEKICAVEGLALTPRMRELLTQTAMAGLTGDERRALILAQLRKT